jgi:hypothetical protein
MVPDLPSGRDWGALRWVSGFVSRLKAVVVETLALELIWQQR